MWNNNNFNQSYPYNYSYRNNYLQNPYMQPMNNYTSVPQQTTSQQPQNNIIWVDGKENARSMQLTPNSTAILLDRGTQKFYIKTTDDIGLGKLRVFNYIE